METRDVPPRSSPNDSPHYTVWIEAEEWIPGTWRPKDSNTDVLVTFADGSRWGATFFSYANIRTLTEKNKQSGECLAGIYFWAAYMLLIEEITRAQIEAVFADLLHSGDFDDVFAAVPEVNHPIS
jgi:hypothetical protein